jgi:hypothetical protein
MAGACDAPPFGVPAMRNLDAPAAPHQIKVITAAKSISLSGSPV